MTTLRNAKNVFLSVCLIATSASGAHAETMGKWNYISADSVCSLTTNQGGAKLIMLITKTRTGVLAVPADQSTIDIGHDYKVNLTIDGIDLPESSARALEFSGAKVLYMGLKATSLARDMPDGLAFRVKMNSKVVFDMDKSGSHDAFAAFVGCSKKFGA